ncbi:MAG: hypothetical protein UY09_C0045G0009 [Parcubacteria group bacterium GW2011_GWA2_47_8]|nr:MAG: hypothetical protein UY09_C0045G0009 [Parcubacteria group bacterium GW2011_GWA2_47_8]OHB20615.1 MAG: hypothetical protein A2666_04720 [Parcubacteria group bacterium RIFCSPHIGHO2_01_FULL_47_10b]
MGYVISHATKSKQITRGKGFEITIPDLDEKALSISFLHITGGRDPADFTKLLEPNKGFRATYVALTDGITVILHEKRETKSIALKARDIITITNGTSYEMSGAGDVIMFAMPAFSSDMFNLKKLRG